jgi:hypothetical protein
VWERGENENVVFLARFPDEEEAEGEKIITKFVNN